MEHEPAPVDFSRLNLLLSCSNCLSLETNLRSVARGTRPPAPNSNEADSVEPGLELFGRLDTMCDAAVAAPGVHEKGMKLDIFCNDNRAESGEDIIEDNEVDGVCG